MTRAASRRTHRRCWLLALLGALLVVAGAAAALTTRLLADDPFASPETVELPPLPEDVAPTAMYLAGPDGARLAQFREGLDPLLGPDPAVAACEAAVGALDKIGTPDQLFAAAAGVPDPATADMAVNHLAVASRFLGRCLEEGEVPDRDELRFTAVVFDRRLEEMP